MAKRIVVGDLEFVVPDGVQSTESSLRRKGC